MNGLWSYENVFNVSNNQKMEIKVGEDNASRVRMTTVADIQ